MNETFSDRTCPDCKQFVRRTPAWPYSQGMCTFCSALLWHSADRRFIAVAYSSRENDRLRLTTFPENVNIAEDDIGLIPESIVRDSFVFPIGESDHKIIVAASDRLTQETLEKLTFVLGRKTIFVYTSPDWIRQQIDRHFA